MISIVKQSGPESLREYAARGYRYDEHTSFTPIKQEIREHLCREQGYICCFCMKRIEPDRKAMQIAHMQNQGDYPNLDCLYSNMIGSCSCQETCNQRQDQHDLKYYPTDARHPIENLIEYDSEGVISSPDPEFNQELNQWLNLNSAEAFLRQNRREIFQNVQKKLKKARNFEDKKRIAQRLLKEWEQRTDGRLKEYCGVAIWMLKKKLQKWQNRALASLA